MGQDFLNEDAVLPGQKYSLFSYYLTHDPEMPAMFKIRGSFETVEEAQKAAASLQQQDPRFNVYVCETGKWGNLISDETITKYENELKLQGIYSAEAVSNYTGQKTEIKMQDIMKNFYKKSKESQESYEKRKKILSKTDDGRKKEIQTLKKQNNDFAMRNNVIREELKKWSTEKGELRDVFETKLNEELSDNLFKIQENNSHIEEYQIQLSINK